MLTLEGTRECTFFSGKLQSCMCTCTLVCVCVYHFEQELVAGVGSSYRGDRRSGRRGDIESRALWVKYHRNHMSELPLEKLGC